MNNDIKGKESENKFFTVEFFGVTFIITSLLLLVCLFFGGSVLFDVGEEIKKFLLGVFGYFSYPFLISLNISGFMMLLGKKSSKSSRVTIFRLAFFLFIVLCLFTTINNLKSPSTLGEYLKNAYDSGRLEISKVVAGGALFSLFTYLPVKYLTYFFSIVIFILILFVDIWVFFRRLKNKPNTASEPKAQTGDGNNQQPPISAPSTPQQPVGQTPTQPPFGYQNPPAPNVNGNYSQPNMMGGAPNGYNNGGYYNQNPYSQPNGNGYAPQNNGSGYFYGGFTNPQPNIFTNTGSGVDPYANAPTKEEAMRIMYGQKPITYSGEYNRGFDSDKVIVNSNPQESGGISGAQVSSPISKDEDKPNFYYEDKSDGLNGNVEEIKTKDSSEYSYFNGKPIVEENNEYESTSTYQDEYYDETLEDFNVSDSLKDSSNETDKNDYSVNAYENDYEEGASFEEDKKETNKASNFFKNLTNKANETSTSFAVSETSSDNIDELNSYSKHLIENMPSNLNYNPPPISLLPKAEKFDDEYQFEVFKAEMKSRILTTLENFGVSTKIAEVHRGPVVTRFDIEVPFNISMTAITKREKDINLRVAATNPIRMIAPVSGTSYVGIEIPNKKREMVRLRDIISSEAFMGGEDFGLNFALGKDVIGNPITLDLARMPHLLVTGTTGSGKSVCLNALMVSLIYKYSPEEVRFIMVDPKAVEFEVYEKLPHLLFGEIIKDDVPLTNAMLTWVLNEMERRYSEFSKVKLRDLKSYNKKMRAEGGKILPRLVLIIDEFADIMLKDKNGVNNKICRLVQKSRAAGIHLVLAAQRPSVDIIEGPIKANLSSRIVFRATAPQDSMTCLGRYGAEKLLGKGDGLYITDGMFDVDRVMGAYVDEEIPSIIEYVIDNNESYFDYNSWARIKATVSQQTSESEESSDNFVGDNDSDSVATNGMDPLHFKAIKLGYDHGGLSISLLQRRLAVGFSRAGRIIDWLTDNGYVTPNMISGKRQMVLTKEEFEQRFSDGENNGD